jgi:hypothetical protein
MDERNLLDHQTALEGKLDEKFFGGAYTLFTITWPYH